jgi:ATP-binding cassette subfamily B (MDR/TAP) protein 1
LFLPSSSSDDRSSERLVQAAIDEVSVGRTTIVVAHRLSTIRDAHKIVVMGEGRVLEEGSHHDLLANIDGPYYRLVNAQKIKEDTTQDHLEDDRDEKTLLKQEADKTQAAATGKLERSVTNVSASSQVLGQKTDNKAKELGGIAVAIRLGRYAGSLKTTYAVGIVAAFVSGCVYPW